MGSKGHVCMQRVVEKLWKDKEVNPDMSSKEKKQKKKEYKAEKKIDSDLKEGTEIYRCLKTAEADFRMSVSGQIDFLGV